MFTGCTLEDYEPPQGTERSALLLTYACDEGSFILGARLVNNTFYVQERSPSYSCNPKALNPPTQRFDISQLHIERFIYNQYAYRPIGREFYENDIDLRGEHLASFCTSVIEAYDLNGSFAERFDAHRLRIDRCRRIVQPDATHP